MNVDGAPQLAPANIGRCQVEQPYYTAWLMRRQIPHAALVPARLDNTREDSDRVGSAPWTCVSAKTAIPQMEETTALPLPLLRDAETVVLADYFFLIWAIIAGDSTSRLSAARDIRTVLQPPLHAEGRALVASHQRGAFRKTLIALSQP